MNTEVKTGLIFPPNNSFEKFKHNQKLILEPIFAKFNNHTIQGKS